MNVAEGRAKKLIWRSSNVVVFSSQRMVANLSMVPFRIHVFTVSWRLLENKVDLYHGDTTSSSITERDQVRNTKLCMTRNRLTITECASENVVSRISLYTLLKYTLIGVCYGEYLDRKMTHRVRSRATKGAIDEIPETRFSYQASRSGSYPADDLQVTPTYGTKILKIIAIIAPTLKTFIPGGTASELSASTSEFVDLCPTALYNPL